MQPPLPGCEGSEGAALKSFSGPNQSHKRQPSSKTFFHTLKGIRRDNDQKTTNIPTEMCKLIASFLEKQKLQG